jgi:hypothetical protein
VHDGKPWTLKPMKDDQIKSDVMLVVRKQKLHKSKPQPRLGKLQHEEHDARSISIESVSTEPVDGNPLVLVGDTPIEVKPLIAERKDITTCSPVCVDNGVQTDDHCADRVSHVSVHMATQVEDCSFVRTYVRHFVGALMCMHTCKDGRVRQLCGPGITPSLQGHTKKVHVQQQRAPSRVEKKVVVPKSMLMWLQNVVSNAMASQASQEGGCGEVGRQDLKMATKHDAVVDITRPFRADPLVLRTMLFKGGTMLRIMRTP